MIDDNRRHAIIVYALKRFASAAREQHRTASQADIAKRFGLKIEDADKFLQDAKDAEAIITQMELAKTINDKIGPKR